MTKQSIGKRVAIVQGGIITQSTSGYKPFNRWYEHFTQTCHVSTYSSSKAPEGIGQRNLTAGSERGMRYSMGIYKEFAVEASKVNPSIGTSLGPAGPITLPSATVI